MTTTFFHGLFIAEALLRDKGVHPAPPNRACVEQLADAAENLGLPRTYANAVRRPANAAT